ncbi:MAG TPA: hypothetical protein VGY55_09320 [Pirellulales bacterium]|nr:hypothetical protein [Pirellulales bacterium]
MSFVIDFTNKGVRDTLDGLSETPQVLLRPMTLALAHDAFYPITHYKWAVLFAGVLRRITERLGGIFGSFRRVAERLRGRIASGLRGIAGLLGGIFARFVRVGRGAVECPARVAERLFAGIRSRPVEALCGIAHILSRILHVLCGLVHLLAGLVLWLCATSRNQTESYEQHQ